MGNCIRSLLRRLQRKRCTEKTIILLIVGLDNAGKTSVLNRISGDSDKSVLPTIGFRTVSLRYKSYVVKIYDIGGSSQIRSLWTKYYSGIHGLIYVVDASDISRLTENKVVFGELISHECISGKPLLLLANKQDISGAIDELDLVENLDVEHAANTMKCPTRVEICSCTGGESQSKGTTTGIKNGYKWLLDTVAKNYTVLNNRFKDTQNVRNDKVIEVRSTTPDTLSRLSIHSNPFKPIRELVMKREEIDPMSVSHLNNGVASGTKLKKMFMHKNKTAPLTTEESVIEIDDISESTKFTTRPLGTQKSLQTLPPVALNTFSNSVKLKPNRPYTAPERSQHFVNKITIINIPGQVTEG
ncbi:ADP-ribosylation factor-like protein 13B [Hylaeus anthracinus]|uniref:ADP-ribosylation factor-like protein 13B n=1 Tax=Hylaeus volcanicus TaxID=313075 RepID=UPI0023B7C08F|nr:ADP-ribosylation factor-like protein 13B [Hylaeus volcanicus]XP_054003855.1 ADP-ribosylation factor-like protein 13B [Hylaeus anthracinus]